MAPSALAAGALPQHRRKQATYGKQSRVGRGALDEGFADDGLNNVFEVSSPTRHSHNAEKTATLPQPLSHPAKKIYTASVKSKSTAKLGNVTQPLPAHQTERLDGTGQPTFAPSKASVFDVPTSDEDNSRQELQKSVRKRQSATHGASNNGHGSQVNTSGTERHHKLGLLRPSKRPRHSQLSHSPEPERRTLLGATGKLSLSVATAEEQRSLPAQATLNVVYKPAQDSKAKEKRPGGRKRAFHNRAVQGPSMKAPLYAKQEEQSTLRIASCADPSGKSELSGISSPEPILDRELFEPDQPDPGSFVLIGPATPPAIAASESSSICNTPKQAVLWSALLPDHGHHDVQHVNTKTLLPPARRLRLNQSTIKGRTRLIDTLDSTDVGRLSSDHIGQDVDEWERATAGVTAPVNVSQDLQSESATGSQQKRSVYSRSQSQVTYAGQRSFLDESTFGPDDLLEHSLAAEAARPESRSATTSFGASQESDDDTGLKGMRSIHELRAAGDSFRFENDLFLDEIERTSGHSFSRKRNALIEICSKLSDVSFRERFIPHGLELRIIVACQDETSPFACSAVAGILIYVLVGPTTTQLASQLVQAGAINILTSILGVDRDLLSLAKDRKSNMSKVAQASVSNFCKAILDASIWEDAAPTSLSPRLLGLKAWELLVRKIRKDGDTTTLLSKVQLKQVLSLLEKMVQRTTAENRLVQVDSLLYVRTMLSLLESLTIVEACALDWSLWDTEALTKLVDCLDTILGLQRLDVDLTPELVLRTCLNLANNHKDNSEVFSKPSLVSKIIASVNRGFSFAKAKEFDSSAPHKLDTLLLALGAMLNLAEWSDAARLAVLKDTEGLDILLGTFIDSRAKVSEADSLAASRVNVAHGYLAVLLGNLCKNERVRSYIGSQLPNGSFNLVSDAVDEFLLHHKEADKISEGNDSWVAFTHRLAAVGGMLKELVQGNS